MPARRRPLAPVSHRAPILLRDTPEAHAALRAMDALVAAVAARRTAQAVPAALHAATA